MKEKNTATQGTRKSKGMLGLKESYLVYAVFAGLLIAGITAWSVANEYRLTLDRERESLVRICELVTEETRQLFSRVEFMLDTVDQWLLANPACDPRFDPAFTGLVETFRKSTQHQIDIRFVSADGGLFYVPSKDAKALSDVRDREYFRVHADGSARGLHVASPVKSRVTKLWGIPISKKLVATNAGMAVVFAAIELPVLSQIYDAARPKANGAVALLRHDGTLLARAPFDDALMEQPWTGFGTLADLEDEQGLFTVAQTSMDSSERLYAHRFIPDYSLDVLVSERTGNLFAFWQRSLMYHLGILVIVLAALGAFSMYVYRLLSRLTHKSTDLEEANQFKDQIFALLSHDLRSPLGSMMNFVDYLEERMQSLGDEEKKSAMTMIRQSGRNIQNLLDNLLAWMKLSKDLAKFTPESLDLDELTKETAALFDIAMAQKGLSLSVHIPGGLKIEGDREMFKSILRNLISNAVKNTRQNSTLEINARQEPGWVVLEVRDQGYGMSAEKLATLFTRTATMDLRTGLGLVLVHDFATAHKGTIHAESTQGTGSVFILRLPTHD